MSTTAIVDVRNMDVNRLSFVVGHSKNGRNPNINIKYDNQNVQVRVPRMNFPGGVLVTDSDMPGSQRSYTLISSLRDCDPYAKDRCTTASDIGKFYNFLLDLEEKIIASAVEHSVKWFGKKRSEEAIRDSFRRILNVSSDKIDGERVPNGKYPPSFRIKIPVYDGRVKTDVVDGAGREVYLTPESLLSVFPKRVDVSMVITGSIYTIAGGGFGMIWRAELAQVFPQARIRASDVFKNEEEEAPQEEEESQQTESVQVQEQVEVTRPASPPEQTPQVTAPPDAPRKKRVGAGK
jgi:hypothetical protein